MLDATRRALVQKSRPAKSLDALLLAVDFGEKVDYFLWQEWGGRDGDDHFGRQWTETADRCRAGDTAVVGVARDTGDDGHEVWVRPWSMWIVHGAYRRRSDPLVRDAGRVRRGVVTRPQPCPATGVD